MEARIVVLPGDGIGPEVVAAALAVLPAVAARYGHTFETEEHLIGGGAIDACGTALPDETRRACLQADAVLLGAVGGPQWDDPAAPVRPEQGLLAIRQAMGLFANLRPVRPHPDLLAASPLRPERLQGVDLLVVRELTGGIYFGTPRERRTVNGEIQAVDTLVYSQSEIRRVSHVAFQAARQRRGKVTSVDKANVLESSRLWRQTVNEVAAEYPGVVLEHVLVDAAAMHLLTRPASFDVIVTENMFGDILTDEASVLAGSMGNLPSASLGETRNRHGFPRGLYEPIHGSAPDIAGRGIANPIGTILSLALLLRHSLGLEGEARAVEAAVAQTLAAGYRTADLAANGQKPLNTQEIEAVIVSHLG
ncbi:MAG: 3-isopropylmalate dehydrogenase [Chloroflexi bacterium]|nr:3-isopropylmalate dehydrogenase [Chloroflexota bacterium]MCI0576782.1 3-isopropylmalate dehydrogenase [Chloroflexota bacterium]MCI0645342.1 3-isopropylmalate dehydrogenase [Chloroflexota bacterium]MCI0725110.1 3-isopropylmalate dehydrogenase [Chloroflexota bacterium]